MSSFKKAKTSSTQSRGTKLSPNSSLTTTVSSGISSLDDILGGGIPLSCSFLVLAPDVHSAYGDLVQKYYISQGLVSEHELCIIGEHGLDFVRDCMWTGTGVDQPEDRDNPASEKIKIAWRYEKMGQFETTTNASNDDYCRTFDLTARVPSDVVQQSLNKNRLSFIDPYQPGTISTSKVLADLDSLFTRRSITNTTPLRVCINALGSPRWGDLDSQHILRFLLSLKALLRRTPFACVSVALAPSIASEGWGGHGWSDKLAWICDGCITLSAFTANPAWSLMFPQHHGFVKVHSVPSPHSMVPASDKHSILRGLGAAGSSGGGSENNLAFKCTRKRLVFETQHLDVEGGVGERRTAPALTTREMPANDSNESGVKRVVPSGAGVQIELETEESREEVPVTEKRTVKVKRKVAFQSDRPEMYDF